MSESPDPTPDQTPSSGPPRPPRETRDITQFLRDFNYDPRNLASRLPSADDPTLMEKRVRARTAILEVVQNTLCRLKNEKGQRIFIEDDPLISANEISPVFSKLDVTDFDGAVINFLDINSPHFNELVTDPEVGAVQLISVFTHMAVQMASRGGSPARAFRYFRALVEESLAVPVATPEGLKTRYFEIEDLPWDKPVNKARPHTSKNLLQRKLALVFAKHWTFMNNHFSTHAVKEPRFSGHIATLNAFGNALSSIIQSYPQLDTSYWLNRWFFIVTHALETTYTTSPMTSGGAAALVELTRQIEGISGAGGDFHSIEGAVQTFSRKTLPALAKQMPQAQPPAPTTNTQNQ